MPFINGLDINPATGRARIDLNLAIPNPRIELAGRLYDSSNNLQVDDSATPPPFSWVCGIRYNGVGQMEIVQSLPGGAPLWVNGLRVSQAGAIAISAGGAIANHVHGWPVTVNGELCIEAGVLLGAFSDGFSGGFE